MIDVVLIGRGGVGVTYGYALSKLPNIRLRFAADAERVKRYSATPFFYNDEPLKFDYFTPQYPENVDLIVIATKWSGYGDALAMCEKLAGPKTQILPLLNGLMAYERAVECFGDKRVLRGYYIGHTAFLDGNTVRQDGVYRTVFGENVNIEGQWSERVRVIAELFLRAKIPFRVDADMVAAQWQKLVVNVGANQATGLDGGISYGQLHSNPQQMELAITLMKEAIAVAAALGVATTDMMLERALTSFRSMVAGDYSSMAQDVRAGRVTEVEIFAGYIVAKGKLLGIETPSNSQILLTF